MRSVFLALIAAALAGPTAAAEATPPPETRARGDTRMLFSFDDYPAAALRAKEEGTVRAQLTVGTDGRVKACKIVHSSNSDALDSATCSILMRRARFTPARDANGRPVEDIYVTPAINWRIVEAPAAPAMPLVQPGRYRCTPPADATSLFQDIVPLQPGVEMRVGFRLLRDIPNGSHRATAALKFDGPRGLAAIAVAKAENEGYEMFASVTPPGSTGQDLVFEYPVTGNWIILRLSLDSDGWLVIRSNDLTQRYKWGAVTKTTLHCHSGEWEIDVWPRSYVPAAGAVPVSAN